jgi:peptide methionine sulfoxide reductase msrA/msrB
MTKRFMITKAFHILMMVLLSQITMAQLYNKLTKEEARVIEYKGTERAFTGEYTDNKSAGTYICRKCNAPLYLSRDKFESHCGWPSFDDEIDGAVIRVPDADGRRTEIICANCKGHLGHVFLNEGYTSKNTRHCVNSISMVFIPKGDPLPMKIESYDKSTSRSGTETAYFASGCFWGTEYYLQQIPGVLSTTVGFTGGTVKNPSYKEVCTGRTGHAETVKVVFDPAKVSYREIAEMYFETHDPTQVNRQGPDIGTQYRSEIFYLNENQHKVAEELVGILESKGLDVATRITPASEFYEAENYHQDYYKHNGKTPYCHIYTRRF